MEKRKREKVSTSSAAAIDLIGDDLLQVVLSKVPARSFASAACVCRLWSSVCRRILSRPKLSSAVSLDTSIKCAVEEVVDKVLSEPIRPHFAILCISRFFSLPLALKYVTENLGSRTPVVSCKSRGIIGKNALTNEFEEIQCEMDEGFQMDLLAQIDSYGVSLTVGFVPGLKVDVLPLLWSEDLATPCVDKFAIDIREYTNSVSGCTSPTGIIMFGCRKVDMKPVLDKMDYAMDPGTFIVGDECCSFLYRKVGDAVNYKHQKENCAGVALLFTKDHNKPRGIGDIQFHFAISAGTIPIGQTYKAVVRERRQESSTRLFATNRERRELINGETMIHDIEEELGDRIEDPVLYIGVTKTRQCFVGLEKARWSTSMAFHGVIGEEGTHLIVQDRGIKTGDYFRFYYADKLWDPISSSRSMSKDLEKLKQEFDASADKRRAFGGFIFSCCESGEPFGGKSNVNSHPFLEIFPGVPVGGTFCNGVIKRDSSSLYGQESREPNSISCCLHPYSSVFLVMSCTPPQLED